MYFSTKCETCGKNRAIRQIVDKIGNTWELCESCIEAEKIELELELPEGEVDIVHKRQSLSKY